MACHSYMRKEGRTWILPHFPGGRRAMEALPHRLWGVLWTLYISHVDALSPKSDSDLESPCSIRSVLAAPDISVASLWKRHILLVAITASLEPSQSQQVSGSTRPLCSRWKAFPDRWSLQRPSSTPDEGALGQTALHPPNEGQVAGYLCLGNSGSASWCALKSLPFCFFVSPDRNNFGPLTNRHPELTQQPDRLSLS